MELFTEWAVGRIIEDAKEAEMLSTLAAIVQNESEQEWHERVGSELIEGLCMEFCMEFHTPRLTHDTKADSFAVFNYLKEKLAAEAA